MQAPCADTMQVLGAQHIRTHSVLCRHWIGQLIAIIGLVVGVGGTSVLNATAQPAPERTLRIQNDTVYIDGVEVPPKALPDELVLEGLQMQYQVYGIDTPTVQIQGRTYRLTESTLEPVPQASTNQSRTADYMDLLRTQSQALYEAVQREYALEHTAEQRAYRIRQLEPGAERTAHLDTLRQTVARLFDLKQANRRREIIQLQQQVEAMQRRMEERAAHREAMIERRVRNLIDLYGGDEADQER